MWDVRVITIQSAKSRHRRGQTATDGDKLLQHRAAATTSTLVSRCSKKWGVSGNPRTTAIRCTGTRHADMCHHTMTHPRDHLAHR